MTLLAAAKGFGESAIRSLVAAGCTEIGESYVQEARRKREALAAQSPPGFSKIRWHFIGRLQRNKARQAVGMFDLLHSLDGLELAAALDRAARAAGVTRLGCLVEVNLAGESSKGGIVAETLVPFLVAVGRFDTLDVRGLMTIPPVANPEESRGFFRRLRELRDETSGLPPHGVRLKELSMGMSDDFEVAIEEGATMIRVGRAIFGPRP